MQTLGYHYRLTEIQAALGDSQLKRLHKFMEKRRKRAEYYLELLFPDSKFTIPKGFNLDDSSHHLFTIIIDFNKCKKSKNQMMFELKQAGIITQVHYMPIPLHPFYSQNGYSTHNLVNALDFYYSVLTIPLFPDLSRRKQRYISNKLKEVIK
jgi:dTDP-4-amino-4,6-dideoxygalactose transaminase